MVEEEIIKSENVPKELQKYLDEDKNRLFLIECDIIDNKLRLGLKELNKYSPYYYEKFYTLIELQNEVPVFKLCRNLEEVKKHLLNIFAHKSSLKSLDNGEKIQLNCEYYDIASKKDAYFVLERKTSK